MTYILEYSKSRTIADKLVADFNLTRVYNLTSPSEARRKLIDRASFASGRDTLIKISVEDTDPGRAAALANAYISELHQQDNRLALTGFGQHRRFFEQRLHDEGALLASAEDKLKDIQKKTGAIQVGSQAEATIRMVAQIRADIAGHEVMLQSLATGATDQNPEVIRHNTELASLRAQLAKFQAGQNRGGKGDPLIPITSVPEVAQEYIRGLRELKYHESLYELLAKQYEASKIDEAKEASAIQVVDAAVPPDRKSWPPRLLLTVTGATSVFVITCIFVLLGSVLAKTTTYLIKP